MTHDGIVTAADLFKCLPEMPCSITDGEKPDDEQVEPGQPDYDTIRQQEIDDEDAS